MHDVDTAEEPVPEKQTKSVQEAASVLAKQFSAVLQQPTTVVVEVVAAYDATQFSSHE